MESSSFQNDKDNFYQSNLKKSHSWEIKYQASLWSVEKIIHEEELRRLKLSTLILKNQKNDLSERILSRDDRITTLEQECEALRAKLAHSEQNYLQQETYLQSQELSDRIEHNSVLSSLDINLTDSIKMMSRGPCLHSDMMALKSNVDSLQSKLLHQDTTVAEKSALELEINSFEDELMNEKTPPNLKALLKKKSQEKLELEKQEQGKESKFNLNVKNMRYYFTVVQAQNRSTSLRDANLENGIQENNMPKNHKEKPDITQVRTIQSVTLFKNSPSNLENCTRHMR